MVDDLDANRQLKARYCRFLDTKDVEAWRSMLTTAVVVELDMTVSTGGADRMTAPPIVGVGNFVPIVMASVENAATMHHCHTPEITLTSPTTATGTWAMEDWVVFSSGQELHGAGHYHETYEKQDSTWRIKSLHLTRTVQQISGNDDDRGRRAGHPARRSRVSTRRSDGYDTRCARAAQQVVAENISV
ncbi:nuclear transport factor 2 family protein [Mycobacterium colombiense]|uniref:nuclear transport factor 2 family protein n=1 Tax=Mycobacterium colombiense TaxID=339268 RepID=UPI0009C17917|nr:nuclear transport factor 2 family protein [Mycobacterium colombiense]